MMRRLRPFVAKLRRIRGSSLLEIAGYCALSAGVAFVFWPAGIIVAGLAAIFLAQGMEVEG